MHTHHNHPHNNGKSVRSRLKVAFVLNFIFTIIELIGGYFTNSVAILSDAIHDLGDTIAIGSALWLEKVSERSRDERYSYGYKRFSTLGALITSVILVAGSVVILYEAIPRLFAPQEVKSTGMMWMAILGITFNGIAALRLRGGGDSLNNKAVMLHLLEDVLGWIVVLIGSIIISYTNWFWIDPLLSLLVAGFILYNVYGNLRSVLLVFLQSTPKGFDINALQSELLKIEGVLDVHDLHSWSMDGDYHILSIHIVVPDGFGQHQIIHLKNLAADVIQQSGIDHPTIAIEFEREGCEYCK
jgi:cobalt-zinc-cadmium efflux system protein